MLKHIHVQKRTVVFATFMTAFFLLLLFLTYYSHVAYYKSLPQVETIMPEGTGEHSNGRYLYVIPEQAVYKEENTGKMFIYTARFYRDVLGERNLVTRIEVYVKEKLDGEKVLVDGIIREEPVIVEATGLLYEGQAVLLEKSE